MRGDWDDVRARCSERYLRHVAATVGKIEVARESLDALAESLGVGGIDYDSVHAASMYRDGVHDAAMRLAEAKARFDAEVAEHAAEVERARALVLALPDPRQAAAVTRRHLMQQPWKEVANAMRVSVQTARRAAEAGLVELYAALPERWRLPEHSAI